MQNLILKIPISTRHIFKLFEDDTSLFTVVNNASVSASRLKNDLVKIRDWAFNSKMSFISACRLNNDLVKIRDWTFNSKMSFIPDPTKQAKEVIFSTKEIRIFGTHPSLFSTIH